MHGTARRGLTPQKTLCDYPPIVSGDATSGIRLQAYLNATIPNSRRDISDDHPPPPSMCSASIPPWCASRARYPTRLLRNLDRADYDVLCCLCKRLINHRFPLPAAPHPHVTCPCCAPFSGTSVSRPVSYPPTLSVLRTDTLCPLCVQNSLPRSQLFLFWAWH